MPTPWDAVYKQVLTQFLSQHNVNVATEVEVGRLPRKIDVVAVCSTKDIQNLAEISPFTFFQQYNLMEFKSPGDPLTPDEYKRILARTYLYLCEVGVDDLSIVTVCAITSGKPTKVLMKVPSLVRFSPVGQGLYKSDDKIPFYVLVVAELPIEERNYPLLLFSKGKQRKVFLQELVQKKAIEYIRFANELYPQDFKEVLIMSKDFPTLEENIRFIQQELVPELIKGMSPGQIARAVKKMIDFRLCKRYWNRWTKRKSKPCSKSIWRNHHDYRNVRMHC